MYKPLLMTGGRYPVLRSVAILSMICAGLAAVAAVVSTLWVLVQLGDLSIGQRLVLAFTILGAGFFVVIGILLFAEVIELFIDMATSLRVLARRRALMGEAPASPEPEAETDQLDETTAELALLRGH